MTLPRPCACILLCALLLSGCSGRSLKEYHSASGQFSIQTPVPLEETTVMNTARGVGYLEVHRCVGIYHREIYSVWYVDYPAWYVEGTDPQKIFDQQRDDLIKGTQEGTLISESRLQVAGKPAQDFTYTSYGRDEEKNTTTMRFILAGQRIYWIGVSSSEENPAPTNWVAAFLNSFQIVSGSAAAAAAECKPVDGRFAITSPVVLNETVSTSPQTGIEQHTFIGKAGDTEYAVAYSDFPLERTPTDEGDRERMLEDSFAAVEKLCRSKWYVDSVKREKTLLDGHTGLALTVRGKDKDGNDVQLRQRTYLISNRLYQVMVTTKSGSASTEDLDAFLNSFRLTES